MGIPYGALEDGGAQTEIEMTIERHGPKRPVCVAASITRTARRDIPRCRVAFLFLWVGQKKEPGHCPARTVACGCEWQQQAIVETLQSWNFALAMMPRWISLVPP